MRQKSMKRLRFILVLAVAMNGPAWSRAEVADGIKAVVNDKVVTYAEVEDFAHDAINALRRQYSTQPEELQKKLNELLNDAMDQLVENQLILHSFDTDGYKLPDGVVDQLVKEQIRDTYGDRVTLIKTLQEKGMTFEQYRQQVRDRYISSALRNQHQRDVVISPVKILDYYQSHQDQYKLEDQVKLRMIVLNKTGADDTNAIRFARELEAKLKDGVSFGELASIYSQGSQKQQQGEWGWVIGRCG